MCLFGLWFSQSMCPLVELWGHMVGLFLVFFFKESPYYSPLWLYEFTFPLIVQEGSLYPTFSPGFIACIFFFFDNSHSDLCEVIPHCSFDLHVSNN